MAYQGETPWHELGAEFSVAARTNIALAMEAANLNWKVDTQPVYLADGRVNPFSVAVVRDIDNAIIGSVGPKTSLVQNEDAFGILDELVQNFGLEIETAGALYNGAQVWMLAKLPNSTEEIVPGDKTEGYTLIQHAHDNGHSLDGILVQTRVVCKNTMAAALAEHGEANTEKGRVFKLKKTRNVSVRVGDAGKTMGQLAAALRASNETFRSLARKSLTPREIAEFIEAVIPIKPVAVTTNAKDAARVDSKVLTERRKAIAALVFEGVGAKMANQFAAKGQATAWGALNAVTEYFDHVRTAEAQTPSAKLKANQSALFGTNAQVKLLALAKARQLVAAA
jgi:phage/plasmid-like protein (TIGR03299 family)